MGREAKPRRRSGRKITNKHGGPASTPVPAGVNSMKGLSHAELDKKFREIGQQILKRSGKIRKITLLPAEKDYKTGEIRGFLADSTRVNNKKRFGPAYRKIQDAQDELLSTSAARELMSGALDGQTLTNQQRENLEKLFENISRVRFSTRHSGFATKNKVMQHPTGKGTGIFAQSSQTMKLHNELDLQRKQEVAHAMTIESNNPKATADSIVRAGLRAAIAITLNVFTAPVTASDVQPYANVTGMTRAELRQQVMAREKLKKIFVLIGGFQEAGQDTRMERPWNYRGGFRSASPPRMASPASL